MVCTQFHAFSSSSCTAARKLSHVLKILTNYTSRFHSCKLHKSGTSGLKDIHHLFGFDQFFTLFLVSGCCNSSDTFAFHSTTSSAWRTMESLIFLNERTIAVSATLPASRHFRILCTWVSSPSIRIWIFGNYTDVTMCQYFPSQSPLCELHLVELTATRIDRDYLVMCTAFSTVVTVFPTMASALPSTKTFFGFQWLSFS